jgi:hypothetical protein
MRREIGVVVLSVMIAMAVIFALFDERVSFTGTAQRAPTETTTK